MGKVEQKKMSRGGGSQRDLSWEYDPKCGFFFWKFASSHCISDRVVKCSNSLTSRMFPEVNLSGILNFTNV